MTRRGNTMMKWAGLPALALGLTLGASQQVDAATVIFEDDFSGGAGNLNTTTPDTTTGGADWVATPSNFLADGSIGGTGAGTATLAFTPTNGLIYTLDLSVRNLATTTTQWLAFGFANGQGTSNSISGSNENRFLEGQTVGIAWNLIRGGGSDGFLDAIRGDTGVSSNGGLDDRQLSWDNWTATSNADLDLRIVLDTTGGTGNWTAAWFAKLPTDASYTQVRSTAILLDESITSVGFGKSDTELSGSVTNFTLTSVPEPGSLALLGLGGLLIARRRRG